MLLAFGFVLVTGAIIQLIIVYLNGQNIWPSEKTDLEWESYFSIFIGLFFINRGLKKKKAIQNPN